MGEEVEEVEAEVEAEAQITRLVQELDHDEQQRHSAAGNAGLEADGLEQPFKLRIRRQQLLFDRERFREQSKRYGFVAAQDKQAREQQRVRVEGDARDGNSGEGERVADRSKANHQRSGQQKQPARAVDQIEP